MKSILAIITPVALLGFSALVASADSISPASYADTLSVGESVTIRKTVTVSEGRPVSSKVDVFFLADETGSMGGQIAAIKAAAATILSSTAGLGDVAFGVGGYRDVGDAFVYTQRSNLTTTQATAQAAINGWTAGGGGDFPEANLFGLEQVAETTSWRAGSERILVWFGDAPSHDPVNGSTEASATAALLANGINVQAINTPVGAGLDSTGQATRITNATGGEYFDGVATADIVDTITDAISTAVSTYTTVGLDLSEAPAGVSVTAVPGSHMGAFDRSIEREFEFDVTFTGVTPGDYAFNIYGTVDGGRVATEADRITVTGDGTVPDGGTSIVLLGLAVSSLGILRHKLAAKTRK